MTSEYLKDILPFPNCVESSHIAYDFGLLTDIADPCAKEINAAEIQIIKILQATRFTDEIKKLQAKTSTNKSKIANLNPFLDENGVIRVGGRLRMSRLTYSQKHSILLPSRHRMTDHIIRETHETHYHTGIQTTLHILRQKF